MMTHEAFAGVRYVVNGEGERTDIIIPWDLWERFLAVWLPMAEELDKREVVETIRFFNARAGRADMDAFRRILNRDGDEPPRPGDEMPVGHEPRTQL